MLLVAANLPRLQNLMQTLRSHCQRGRLRKCGGCGACSRTVASQRTTAQESYAPKSTNSGPLAGPREVKIIEVYQWLSRGGGRGIRTLDRALGPYNGLANRRLQPLGHPSA